MKLTIHDKRKIHEIQKEFSEMFPSLKLHVFAHPHNSVVPTHKLLMDSTKTVRECRHVHAKGDLEITPNMTIWDLKKGLGDNFGLSVEVYHKIGNDWLETASDSWTLEKHNSHATELNAEGTLEKV
jgi:hypothetical protein